MNHKIFKSNYFITIIFAVLALLSGIIFLHYHFVGGTSDIHFHWQRIFEIRKSLLQGEIFPKFNLNQQGQNGGAIMSMYPYFNLYPVVLLSFVIKKLVILTYVMFMIRNFVSMVIAFSACHSFVKNKKISFVFAISYTLSSLVMVYCFHLMDMGVSGSMVFMPLALFGLLNLIHHNKWLQLSIGMSLVIFCHVLNAIILVLGLLIIMLFNTKIMRKENYISLLKAIIVSLLCTSIFWLPFIYLNLSNKISLPISYFTLAGNDFNPIINGILSNQVTLFINIIAFIGIILGAIFYKKLDLATQKLFIIALIFLFICSDFFPWIFLNDTILKTTLQFSWRLYVIPQLLLCYVFAICFNKLKYVNKHSIVSVGLLTILIMSFQMDNQKSIINDNLSSHKLTKPYTKLTNINFKIYNNSEFMHLINDYNIIDQDYLPNQSLRHFNQLQNRQAFYKINKKIHMKLKGNGKFTFKAPRHIKELHLPFVYYNGVNYQVNINGKQSSYHADASKLMTINNIQKGHNTVQIIVHNSWYNIVGYILSLVGLLVSLCLLLLRIKKQTKFSN